MTLITPEDRVARTADLLRSLEDSVRALRKAAEDLKQRIEAGEDADLVDGSRQVEQAARLVRSCQKVEESLVEQHERRAGIVRGGYALDLDRARSDIGCRLARLRACGYPRDLSE